MSKVGRAQTAFEGSASLFENPGSVDEVVRDLEASGFPREDVRVLSEPLEMAGSGLMSTQHNDFEVCTLTWKDLGA